MRKNSQILTLFFQQSPKTSWFKKRTLKYESNFFVLFNDLSSINAIVSDGSMINPSKPSGHYKYHKL